MYTGNSKDPKTKEIVTAEGMTSAEGKSTAVGMVLDLVRIPET